MCHHQRGHLSHWEMVIHREGTHSRIPVGMVTSHYSHVLKMAHPHSGYKRNMGRHPQEVHIYIYIYIHIHIIHIVYIVYMHYICHLHGSSAIYMADLWNLIIHYRTVTVVTVVTVVSKQKRNETSPSTVAHPIHRTPRWCDELRELAALVIIGVGRRGATGAPEPQHVAPTARPQPIGGSSLGSWLVSHLWLFVWCVSLYLEFDGFQVGTGMVPVKRI